MHKKIENLSRRFQGYKVTPQRRLVLEVFLENEADHLSAEEVFQLARAKDREIGIATIYRTLDLLVEVGILHPSDFGDGRKRYELSLAGREEHHHHHLICLQCRQIQEVEEDLLSQLEGLVEKDKGFLIVDHRVQFFGYCRECRAREAGKDTPAREE
jgi:Fur family transcriptional regulator, ferric uptake regulator